MENYLEHVYYLVLPKSILVQMLLLHPTEASLVILETLDTGLIQAILSKPIIFIKVVMEEPALEISLNNIESVCNS